MMKRLLAVFLAMIMVFSLMPVFATAAEESTESYVYNFYRGLHTEDSYITKCVEWASTDSSEAEWTSVGYYHSGAGTNAGIHNTNYFAFNPKISNQDLIPVYSPGVAIDVESQFTSVLTLKINIEENGTYVPELTLATETCSPKWEVLLTKANGELDECNSTILKTWMGSLDSSNRLGIIDGYGSGADVTEVFKKQELEAGEYYLTFVTNGKNASCVFTDEGNDIYRIKLLLKKFSLRNVNETPVVQDDASYNLTSSALADPTLVSNFCDTIDYSNNGIWTCTNLLTLGYDDLADSENQYAYEADLYCRNGSFSENGITAYLWSSRYVETTTNSSNFTDTDGDGKAETESKTTAYAASTYVQFKINVPEAGKYKLYLYNKESDNYGCLSCVFFGSSEQSVNTLVRDIDGEYELANKFDSATTHTDGVYMGDVVVSEDNQDYSLVFSPDYDCFQVNKKTLQLSTTRKGFQSLHISGIRLEAIAETVEENETVEQEYSDIKNTKTDEIASSVASGLSNTATVNILTTEVNGDEAFEETARKVTGTYGDMITVTADEKEGFEFLYWAKGMGTERKVVSESEKYTFKATSGGTWLTAVYKDTSSEQVSVVFYNGNGDEVSRMLVDEGTDITLPNLPTLTGHEASKGWALGNQTNIYSAGDTVAASGSKMFFVAQFDDPAQDTITVKVNDEVYGTYAYGEKVTVEATERENGSGENVFVYWKKGEEIVSFDKEYSFKAWEDCELTACYASYRPITEALRKIIITEDEDNNLMTEFIGFGDAVEKGILFNGESESDVTFANATHKIPMSTSGDQLAALNDVGTYVGYAILSDGSVVYDK